MLETVCAASGGVEGEPKGGGEPGRHGANSDSHPGAFWPEHTRSLSRLLSEMHYCLGFAQGIVYVARHHAKGGVIKTVTIFSVT